MAATDLFCAVLSHGIQALGRLVEQVTGLTMGKIIYSQVTAFRVLNYAPNGTPVILVQWTRSDWNNSGETKEHIAWEYGDWVKVLLKTIGAKDVVEAKGMEIRIDIDKSGWMKRIGNATSDMWWSPSDWFDPALSKAVEAWN